MSHLPDPPGSFTNNKSVDHSYVPQKYSQNPMFEEDQCQSNSINFVQVPDYDIRKMCSSGIESSSESMFICVENNAKISVSQQMPANTRARGTSIGVHQSRPPSTQLTKVMG